MKISFNWPIENPKNGPSFFLFRLAQEFQKHGIKIENNPYRSDVYISFIQDDVNKIKNLIKHGIKTVQRLDNIYFDSKNTIGNSNELNKPILDTYQLVHGVIFQSIFSKELIEYHFGKKKNAVIHNGISIGELKNKDENIILCSSSWRRHKRLKEIVDIFLNLDSSYRLVVLGKADCSLPDRASNIITESFESVKDLYMKSSVFLHLCWFDSCPNAVIEALSVGLPVVCGNQGGTKELVLKTNGGFVAETDSSFDFNFIDLYNPPRIRTDGIIEFISGKKYPIIDRAPISIEFCAKKYIDFFQQL